MAPETERASDRALTRVPALSARFFLGRVTTRVLPDVGTGDALFGRVAAKDSGDRFNVAGRVNVARAVNVGSSDSVRSASTKQKVHIVQRQGEAVVNEFSDEVQVGEKKEART